MCVYIPLSSSNLILECSQNNTSFPTSRFSSITVGLIPALRSWYVETLSFQVFIMGIMYRLHYLGQKEKRRAACLLTGVWNSPGMHYSLEELLLMLLLTSRERWPFRSTRDSSPGLPCQQSLAQYPQGPTRDSPRDSKTSGEWNTASAPIQSRRT